MGRKVFLSVLGTTYYRQTKYYFNENKEIYNETRFIQEATLWYYTQIEKINLYKVYIFLTDKAKESNWEHPAQKNSDCPYDGLSKILNDNYSFDVEPISIPEGKTENELWQIFEIMYNVFERDDEVYLDITHSFRSLPIFLIVLLNYAKTLKNIKVRKITYGNWEARDRENYAPVIDLTAVNELQNWTIAAGNFIRFGNVDEIASLLPNNENIDILKSYFNSILSVRGKNIIQGMRLTKVKKSLKKNDHIEPFNILSNEIFKEIQKFKESNINNGFEAVEFCIKHNFIQQGITLLEEFIITKVLESLSLKDKIYSYRYRNAVSKALEKDDITEIKKQKLLPENSKENLKKDLEDLVKTVFSLSYKKELSEIYKEFSTSIRNDINHAGFRDNPKKEEELKNFLEKSYNEVKKIFKIN